MDAGEPIEEMNRKLKTSFDVLLPDIEPSKIIIVLNKIDRLENIHGIDPEGIKDQVTFDYEVKDLILISAFNNEDKDRIIQRIQEIFEYPNNIIVELPNIPKTQSFISWIYGHCDIESISYRNGIRIDLRYKTKDHGYITRMIDTLNGKILEINHRT